MGAGNDRAYKRNNREDSDSTRKKALSEMIVPLAYKNLLSPRGYSEAEKGLQQFSSRAATMTTDI